MKFTNKTNLPEPVARALMRDNYTRGASNRSVTQIIDSPRVRILYNEYWDDLTEDVADRVYSVLGTAVHRIFEIEASDSYLPEERMYYDVNGLTYSGAIDIQFLEDKAVTKLIDYKCTSVYSIIFGKVEWHNQLNAYAWLVRKTKGFTVAGLEVTAILRDWKERESRTKGKDYPSAACVVETIPLWTVDEQDAYIEERIALHEDADFEWLTGGTLPHCTPQERWQRPTTFAVKKIKNKTASGGRVLDTLEEAQAYITKNGYEDTVWEIVERTAEPIRCARGYCKVAHICDQYQSEVWNNEPKGEDNDNKED